MTVAFVQEQGAPIVVKADGRAAWDLLGLYPSQENPEFRFLLELAVKHSRLRAHRSDGSLEEGPQIVISAAEGVVPMEPEETEPHSDGEEGLSEEEIAALGARDDLLSVGGVFALSAAAANLYEADGVHFQRAGAWYGGVASAALKRVCGSASL